MPQNKVVLKNQQANQKEENLAATKDRVMTPSIKQESRVEILEMSEAIHLRKVQREIKVPNNKMKKCKLHKDWIRKDP